MFAWQGRTGRAFDWLGHAYDEHDAGLSYVKYDPFLSKLRGDPRYPALLKKLHLPLD